MNKSKIYEQLKIDEGVIYEIYLDHLGYKTLGVGHLVKESELEWDLEVGTTITKDLVFSYFNIDLDNAMRDCGSLFVDDFRYWPDEVQEILVNMMFNLGYRGLSKFVNFRAALTSENWCKAAKEGRDSKWYRQVTNRAERLMSRLENVE